MELVQRAKNLVLSPASEWQTIAPETTSPGQLFGGYVAPLAAIGPIALFIGLSLVGVGIPFVGTYRMPMLLSLSTAVVSFVFALAGVFVLALIINALAPSFGGEKNSTQALKVAAYAYTPAWLAAVLQIFPPLGILVLLGSLYSLYVLYVGLPPLMKAPKEKALGYTAVVVICAIVLSVVFSVIAGAIGGFGLWSAGSMGALGSSTPSRQIAKHDGNDALSKLEKMAAHADAASKKMEAAAQSGDTVSAASAAADMLGAVLSGGQQVEPIDAAQLKAMLPETIAGLKRAGIEAEKTALGGMKLATAKAVYRDNDGREIRLALSDAGGAAFVTAFAAWALVEAEKETDDGYERTGKVNGRPTHERYSKSRESGEYGVLVAGRFVVTAEGERVDVKALKKAVASVDLGRLEAMKNVGVAQR